MENNSVPEKINPLSEIIDPFINLFKAPRALWGINLSYVIEGLTYFGVLGLLAIYFNQYINLDDIDAGIMVGVLTWGITLAMLFFGATVDWIGVRKSLLVALFLFLIGRILLSLAPDLGMPGFGGSAHLIAMAGILGIIIGLGIYQPACYAAVRRFTSPKTAAMGFAMLYGLMNLGGFLPGLISPPIRRAYGIVGVFWVYVALTVAGIIVVAVILTKKAIADAAAIAQSERSGGESKTDEPDEIPQELREKVRYYIRNIPLSDKRFMFFIFSLIPVQTLFAHNWLTLPQYFSRAFTGIVSENFEFFVNFNPILIFVLAPIVAALTSKKDTYRMMIIGTFIMASPTFILALGPSIWGVFGYLLIMTVGEAMWQPRFLQWIAEIAPRNMTGIYMGIGQFPWFLTKFITSLYSGWFLSQYCPDGLPPEQLNTEFMWLIYGCIAIASPVMLILAKGWIGASLTERVKQNS